MLPRQQEIVRAAARLFHACGYAATSMRDLAAALGVTSAALYYHFPGKEDLLVAVMRQGVELVQTAVTQAMAGYDDPLLRIRAGLRAHLLACLEHQEYVSALLYETRALSPAAQAEMVRVRDAYEALWAETLAAAQQAGIVRPGIDTRLVRLLCFGAINWAVLWFRPAGPYQPAQIADALLDYLSQGVFVAEALRPAQAPGREVCSGV